MLQKKKTIALVAHDNRKEDLREWVRWNCKILVEHSLVCTGTSGRLVEEAIKNKLEHEKEQTTNFDISILKSGPLGGDQQLGAMIAEGRIDMVIFFWDPMQPHPHDVDVKALLRIAVVYNIPIACNRSTADFIISSPLMDEEYLPAVTDYSAYLNRDTGAGAPALDLLEDEGEGRPEPKAPVKH
jgi:methylglyoxal synthase